MTGAGAVARPVGPARWLARRHPRTLALLAAVAGALQVCAYAPIGWRIFAVLSPALLFVLWRQASPRRGLWLGWLYGLGLFGAGVSWIYFSLHLFGDAVAPLAALLTAGFVAGMALYPALLGCLLCRLRWPPALWFGLLAPAAWALAEWVRGWFLTGFPWLLLGHSQVEWPLAGYLPLIGSYGVSALVAASAGALAWLAVSRPGRRPLLGAALVLAGLWGGGQALRQVDYTAANGEPIRVRMVQGNVEQHVKFLARILDPSIRRYSAMSLDGPPVDLVIWPETAVPTLYHRVAERLTPVARELAARGTDLAIGVLEYRQSERRYFNAVRRLSPLSDPAPVYLKHHLVPFGEYMPLREWVDFIARYILIPMSDIVPGPAQQAPLPLAGHLAAVSICYEDAFGEEVIRQLPAADFLLNVSNDAWFGDSLAPHQHLEIARVRTLETRRPMARSTNTGISALIDFDGRILARSPQFKAHALDGRIQPRAGATPYVRFGNTPVVAALMLALLSAAAATRLARKQS